MCFLGHHPTQKMDLCDAQVPTKNGACLERIAKVPGFTPRIPYNSSGVMWRLPRACGRLLSTRSCSLLQLEDGCQPTLHIKVSSLPHINYSLIFSSIPRWESRKSSSHSTSSCAKRSTTMPEARPLEVGRLLERFWRHPSGPFSESTVLPATDIPVARLRIDRSTDIDSIRVD